MKDKKLTKICFITTVPGTIRSFVLKSAEYIHEHTDWDISFICSYDEDFATSIPEFIHYYPVNMKRGISFDGIKVIKQMRKIFTSEQFDIVQYSTPNASLYASIAAKSAKIPIRLYCQWGIVYTGYHGVKRILLKKEEKFVCKNSTWIEPDSKSNLEFARNEGLYSVNKSSIVWNGSACGVNLAKFDIAKKDVYRKSIRQQYHIPEDAFVYVFVGRVNRAKGINELLKAYQGILSDHLAYLFILGSSEVDASVDKELYQWSQEENTIIYTGITPIVEQYLAASDCFVLPSYREGFGMSVIEAQGMGLPVIVTDIPGPIDGMIDGRTGLTVPLRSVSELQNAMVKLYDDVDLRERFGQEGYKNVSDNFEQQHLFKEIVDDRKRLLCDNQKNEF